MNILIYGKQTSTRVKATRLAINSMLQYLGVSEVFNVKTVVGPDIHDTSWHDNTRLVIMPGVYGHGEHIEEDVVKNIYKFIESGGSYLAMCAGAYTSCDYTTYKSLDMAVTGHGKLNVFPATAKGSVYYPTCFHSTVNSRMIPVTCNEALDTTLKGELYALYNGGPEFLPNTDFTEYETIATYTDYPHKKAIIKRELGKGRVLLSGVYPILNVEYVEKSEYTEEQRTRMETYRGDQRKLWTIFLKYLLHVDVVSHTWKRSRDSYDS